MSEHIYLSTLKFIEAVLKVRHSSEFSKLCVNVTAGSGITSRYNELPKAAASAIVVQLLVSSLLIST